MFDELKARIRAAFLTAFLNIQAIWASSASFPLKLVYTVRQGFVIIAAVVALGVLTIVIPIVYLISVSVGNTLPAGGLTPGQSSTLQTLVNNGGSALVLTTTAETVSWDNQPANRSGHSDRRSSSSGLESSWPSTYRAHDICHVPGSHDVQAEIDAPSAVSRILLSEGNHVIGRSVFASPFLFF